MEAESAQLLAFLEGSVEWMRPGWGFGRSRGLWLEAATLSRGCLRPGNSLSPGRKGRGSQPRAGCVWDPTQGERSGFLLSREERRSDGHLQEEKGKGKMSATSASSQSLHGLQKLHQSHRRCPDEACEMPSEQPVCCLPSCPPGLRSPQGPWAAVCLHRTGRGDCWRHRLSSPGFLLPLPWEVTVPSLLGRQSHRSHVLPGVGATCLAPFLKGLGTQHLI